MQKRIILRQGANYSVNVKALRRWATDRLQIRKLEDGSTEAMFLFEGTTCSNFGHPLVYQYFVKLAPTGQQYKIEQMKCTPVDGDEGHKSMCEYMKNAAELIHQIELEKPLLGNSLDEVPEWSWPSSPEGCYCKQESRIHKWGLVLQTIHFALAQGN